MGFLLKYSLLLTAPLVIGISHGKTVESAGFLLHEEPYTMASLREIVAQYLDYLNLPQEGFCAYNQKDLQDLASSLSHLIQKKYRSNSCRQCYSIKDYHQKRILSILKKAQLFFQREYLKNLPLDGIVQKDPMASMQSYHHLRQLEAHVSSCIEGDKDTPRGDTHQMRIKHVEYALHQLQKNIDYFSGIPIVQLKRIKDGLEILKQH